MLQYSTGWNEDRERKRRERMAFYVAVATLIALGVLVLTVLLKVML